MGMTLHSRFAGSVAWGFRPGHTRAYRGRIGGVSREGVDGILNLDLTTSMKYIYPMNVPPMTVVETAPFLRDAKALLPEDERASLVLFLGKNPEAGDLIEDTGGVRKLRWARKGGGKAAATVCCIITIRSAYRFSCSASMPKTLKNRWIKRKKTSSKN